MRDEHLADADRRQPGTRSPAQRKTALLDGKILSEIDKIAQSRAELEKANARMLLGLRRVLSTTQWQTLQTLNPGRREGRGDHFGHRNRENMRGGNDASPPPSPDGEEF